MSFPIMATITRAQFCAAVDAGFAKVAAGTDTEAERDALRQVAANANVVGSNFDSGCPMTLAFGGFAFARHRLMNFTWGYDDALLNIIGYGPYQEHGEFLIRIVD